MYRSLQGQLAGAVVAATLIGCGDGTDPSREVLLGQWGSSSVALVAIRAGAEVRLPCAEVIIDDPIELSHDSSFSVLGRLDTSMAIIGDLPTVRITGRASGTGVSLTVPEGTTYPAATYELEAGVVPPPLNEPICPL